MLCAVRCALHVRFQRINVWRDRGGRGEGTGVAASLSRRGTFYKVVFIVIQTTMHSLSAQVYVQTCWKVGRVRVSGAALKVDV